MFIIVSALCSLAPVSVHAAFDKAAHYFEMNLVHIPLDKKTMKVDVKVRARSNRTVGAGCDSSTLANPRLILLSAGHEESNQQKHRHACVFGTPVSTWNHGSC